MDQKQIKQTAVELMGRCDIAYLGTVDEAGYPQIRAMANPRNKEQFADCEDLFEGYDQDMLMYFATGLSSAKIQHITANPKGSAYFCDAAGNQTLLLTGTMAIINDEEIKKRLWRDGWDKHFAGGIDDPEYVVISLQPVMAKGWLKTEPFEFSF